MSTLRAELAPRALEDPPHVRVHGQDRVIEREAPYRVGRVAPDSGQLGQVFRPAVGGDASCCAVQVERAAVVAEPLPRTDDVRSGRGRKNLDRWPALEPSEVARDDARDLGLLEHDLGDEDRVRVARLSPGEVAAAAPVPDEEGTLH
jgi:hypothetical protein